MPKTDAPAEGPVAARPPRPAPRDRLEARVPGAGAAVPGAYSEFRLAASGGVNAAQAGVGTAPTRDLHDAPSDEARARGGFGRANHAEASPTERAVEFSAGEFSANPSVSESSFGSRRELIGGLPLASLEGPSMASLDLTPSPVPRVSLMPASGADDVSLVPGPHVVGSRNLPTLAARHAFAPPRARAAARAVTFPPQEEPSSVRPRASKLSTRVRSSKREIVLGLTIGAGLSLVLAGLGRAYLDGQGEWEAQADPSLTTATLSALPRPAETSPSPAPAAPSAAGDATLGPGKLGAHGERTPGASPSDAVTEPRKSGVVSAPGVSSETASKRAASARAPLDVRNGSLRARPRKPAAGEVVDEQSLDPADLPQKTPLSPSESAGLGLDLPL